MTFSVRPTGGIAKPLAAEVVNVTLADYLPKIGGTEVPRFWGSESDSWIERGWTGKTPNLL
jgi:hypothetical protein